MSRLRDFQIDIYGLSNGEHEFNYEIGDSFFDEFEDSYAEKGNLKVKLKMIKNERMLDLRFDISGTVALSCDRSLDEYDQPVETNDRLIMRFAAEDEEVSDDIVHIRYETHQINVAQYMYEFIGLSLPMKRLHPRFQDEDDDEETEVKLIYSSPEHAEGGGDESEKEVDPRWKVLKDLGKRQN